MSDKARKDEVDYSRGSASASCGRCRYYGDRSCSLVEGRIERHMWCELFKQKEKDNA